MDTDAGEVKWERWQKERRFVRELTGLYDVSSSSEGAADNVRGRRK